MGVKITYIGHATTMIESNETRILTDPIFSKKVGFITRQRRAQIDFTTLPEISAILISHEHLDHLDFPSFNYIKTTVPLIVPEGSQKLISKHLPNPIIELSNWASHEFGNNLKIHSVPVNHSSFRICPCSKRNASAYVIELDGKTVFFCGDSAYNPYFKDIGNTYSIDTALLPIGAYKPEFFMKRFHMDPGEALQAFVDLNAKKMIPIHWGVFRLSLEKLDEPIPWLRRIADERGLADKVEILDPGESYGL